MILDLDSLKPVASFAQFRSHKFCFIFDFFGKNQKLIVIWRELKNKQNLTRPHLLQSIYLARKNTTLSKNRETILKQKKNFGRKTLSYKCVLRMKLKIEAEKANALRWHCGLTDAYITMDKKIKINFDGKPHVSN